MMHDIVRWLERTFRVFLYYVAWCMVIVVLVPAVIGVVSGIFESLFPSSAFFINLREITAQFVQLSVHIWVSVFWVVHDATLSLMRGLLDLFT